MSRKALFFAFVFLLIFTIGHAQQESNSTEASQNKDVLQLQNTIIMEPPEDGMEANRKSVQFPHLQHALDHGCSNCHHTWELEELESPYQCVECHDNFETTHGDDSYFGAFHSRGSEYSCVGCHYKEGGDAGPLKCPVCH
ncbi:MAG: cytochrome c3 family protein [Desulfohalobiaceae bacterium]|nr:cytochrome c3 family protein [Desulfohalobiaceae bacterium]